jgi:hypothetical protein
MRYARTGFIAAVATISAASVSLAAEPSGAAPASVEPEAEIIRAVGDEDISSFAASVGVSTDDAALAFAHTDILYDWVVANAKSHDVGAVWVTYDDGYRVHARVLEDSTDEWVRELESKVAVPIERHSGGASLGALFLAAEYLQSKGSAVLYDLNVVEGYLDIAEPVSIPEDILPSRFIRVVDQSDNVADSAAASAGHIWDNWNGTYYYPGCTVGYTARVGTTGFAYVATAAHCTDGWHQARSWNAVEGETVSANFYSEACTAGDLQWQRINAGVNHLVYDVPSNSYGVLHAVAGGWYPGQPAALWGRMGSVRWGNIQTTGSPYGTYGLSGPAADDCASSGINFTGIRIENIAAIPGDSGGAITLLYNNLHYLAAILSTNTSSTIFGPWVANLPKPVNTHICVAVNPC